jgi:hypothetical protein
MPQYAIPSRAPVCYPQPGVKLGRPPEREGRFVVVERVDQGESLVEKPLGLPVRGGDGMVMRSESRQKRRGPPLGRMGVLLPEGGAGNQNRENQQSVLHVDLHIFRHSSGRSLYQDRRPAGKKLPLFYL